jgi:vancomycin resistance protein VanJ
VQAVAANEHLATNPSSSHVPPDNGEITSDPRSVEYGREQPMPLTTTDPKSFTITCRCGERFHVDERSVGRRLKCRCGRTITVRGPRRRRRNRIRAAGRRLKSVGAAIVQASRRRSRDAAGDRHLYSYPISRVERIATRTLTILTWGYLAAVCSIAVVMWTLGDRWWIATILLFMGRWIFLVPLALLIPAAILVRRRLVGVLVLGGLVVAGPVMGARTGWRTLLPAAPPNGFPLRVVSFNADAGRLLAINLPIVLVDWKPDVVALQECGEELVRAVRAVPGWYHHSANGLCFLSRYPIRDSSVMDRAALEVVHKSSAQIGGSGAVVRYVIATPSGDVQVTNLHLETPRKGIDGLADFDVDRLRENTRLRDIESDLARRWVDEGAAKRTAPVLVAGDFNTTVESRIFQTHWSDGLEDAFSRVGRGLGMTKYNGWIRVRIDHVLAGPQWYVRRTEIGYDVGSDHRPLIVDLVLPARSSPGRDSTP